MGFLHNSTITPEQERAQEMGGVQVIQAVIWLYGTETPESFGHHHRFSSSFFQKACHLCDLSSPLGIYCHPLPAAHHHHTRLLHCRCSQNYTQAKQAAC